MSPPGFELWTSTLRRLVPTIWANNYWLIQETFYASYWHITKKDIKEMALPSKIINMSRIADILYSLMTCNPRKWSKFRSWVGFFQVGEVLRNKNFQCTFPFFAPFFCLFLFCLNSSLYSNCSSDKHLFTASFKPFPTYN